MSLPDDRLSCLIDNAECLVNYNTQTGVLPSSNLEEALKKVKSVELLEFVSEEAITLRNEVFRLVQAIKPATLPEIRRFYPYSSHQAPEKTRFDKIFPYALGVLTAVLVVFCAHYTMWTNHASTFMKNVESAQRELASERFTELMSRWGATPFLDSGTNGETENFDVRAIETDFQLFHGQYYTTFERLSEREMQLNKTLNPIRKTIAEWRVRRQIAKAQKAAATREPTAGASENGSDQAEQPYFQELANQTSPNIAGQSGQSLNDVCLDGLNATNKQILESQKLYLANLSQGAGTDQGSLVQPYQFQAWAAQKMRLAHLRAALCLYGGHELYSPNVDTLKKFYYVSIRRMRDTIDVLSSWVLPGIYGALGAILLTMQVYTSPILPEPRKFRTIARILMGGFVGIIVGWFWSPKSDELFEFANISLELFTVAFLFGYGIDVFMNLLERGLGLVAGAVERIGSSPAKT